MYKEKIKVFLEDNDEIFFGYGIVSVLKTIEKTGTIKAASIETGISYSKILTILDRAERILGYKIVNKKRGGIGGGAATLSKEIKELIEKYETYKEDISSYAKEKFKEYFNNK